ncbi:hypothetical protein ASD89_21505 [Caulobacter sp. Root656]|nr:hypothetical protein ASD89_21505 [Caulobacter sp. Root656]
MNVGHVERSLVQGLLDALGVALQRLQTLHERSAIAAVLDGRDDAGDGSARLLQAQQIGLTIGPTVVVEPVGLLDVSPHRLGHDLRGHELVSEPRQNSGLQHIAIDGATVGAALAHDVADAAEPVVPALGDRAATDAAFQQA